MSLAGGLEDQRGRDGRRILENAFGDSMRPTSRDSSKRQSICGHLSHGPVELARLVLR